MLIDRNLMRGPFRPFFGGKLGCVVASPENFSRLHAEAESIGVCPEGQRGALTRKDTISLRGRGLTVMALKNGLPILPTATAGAEAMHKDVTDLFGPAKPYIQRPLDFLKDFIFECCAVPIVPGAVTPAGPFPLFALPPGQAFADKIHTEIGQPILPEDIVTAYNAAHGTQIKAPDAGNTYEKHLKRLLSKCYRHLRPNGEYHNDDTERFRDVLMHMALQQTQPSYDALLESLPTSLQHGDPIRFKRDTTGRLQQPAPQNLAQQLAQTLSDTSRSEIFHSFRIVELISSHLTEDMNKLLYTGHDIVTKQKQTPEDARRRLNNNFLTLISSAHLWWLSHKFHHAILPPLYANGIQALYATRVLFELGRDALTVLRDRKA